MRMKWSVLAVVVVVVLAARMFVGCDPPSCDYKAYGTCYVAEERAQRRFEACYPGTNKRYPFGRTGQQMEGCDDDLGAKLSCEATCVEASPCSALDSRTPRADPFRRRMTDCQTRCTRYTTIPSCTRGTVIAIADDSGFECVDDPAIRPREPDGSARDGGRDGGVGGDGGCGTGCGGVTLVAAGQHHSCAVVAGTVKCWGANAYQQAGVATPIKLLQPTVTKPTMAGAVALSAGADHTCAILGGGEAWCWGRSAQGQVGAGGIQTNLPTFIGLAKTTAISAADDHTCAAADQKAWCWGSNEQGKLGTGGPSNQPKETPQRVPALSVGVTAIAAGGLHSCAIVSGAIKCWGNNDYGQLGSAGPGKITPVDGPALAGVTAIVAGTFHTCALAGGAVKCWGKNDLGQLGDGSTTDSPTPVDVVGLGANVTALSAGEGHTCAVVAGAAKCWGDNARKQLGAPSVTTASSTSPVDVQGLGSGVTQIDCGYRHTCAVVGAAAKCWGDNEAGQLGNGKMGAGTESATPVDVPL
ncbi:MAG: hypothetical protein IT371_07995 [Deltaproteobacteria bacterium]|nr:hypothetical protein [Deltaproteobacteria bacterium]